MKLKTSFIISFCTCFLALLAFQNINPKPVLLLSKTEIKLENTALWEKLSSEEKPFKELDYLQQLQFF